MTKKFFAFAVALFLSTAMFAEQREVMLKKNIHLLERSNTT